ncbi:MAG: GNAT family N-acetyltransferase [Bacteroidales bacterium]|jgi:RimJ/RimL family protein N-acetyltransferase|nr:GNAT family N-acetyltransferase [Bacteroidales bacterium]
MLIPFTSIQQKFLLSLFSTYDVQRHLDLPVDYVNNHTIAAIYSYYSIPQRLSFYIYSNNQSVGFISAALNKKHKTASLSFALLPEFRHKGVMQSAIHEMCILLWQQSIIRIEAQVLSENKASLHVLQQCGFMHEGILRKNFMIENSLMDSYIMAKINE